MRVRVQQKDPERPRGENEGRCYRVFLSVHLAIFPRRKTRFIFPEKNLFRAGKKESTARSRKRKQGKKREKEKINGNPSSHRTRYP